MNMAPLELREKKKEPIRKFVHFQTTNMAAYRLLLSTLIKRTTKKYFVAKEGSYLFDYKEDTSDYESECTHFLSFHNNR
jgi:hypothetical protein